jgi:hypothetical protein
MKDPLRGFEAVHAKLDLVAQVCKWAVQRHRRKNSSQILAELNPDQGANGQLGMVLSDNPTTR